MDNIVSVEVVDGSEDLFYGLRSVLLGEFALLANPVEELSSGGKLSDDIIFVLESVSFLSSGTGGPGTCGILRKHTLDSNQSTNWTI